MNQQKKWYLVPPVIILGLFFIIKLIDQSKIIKIFPLDYRNDWASHIAKLFFLDSFSYNQVIPYWYNGFFLFKAYPPGWYYFALPFQKLFENPQLVAYFSLILLFVIAFLVVFFFGKFLLFSKLERIFFFVVLFANPISIGNFVRLGRLPELLSWVIFLAIFFLIAVYKTKRIGLFFFISLTVLLSLLILSHPSATIMAALFILSLFLIKPLRQKFFIFLSVLLSLVITSFWWIPFIFNSRTIVQDNLSKLVSLNLQTLPDLVASILFPIVFLALFFYYWKCKNKSKRELVFFLPTIFLSVLILFRVIVFVPILSTIQPDSFNIFLLIMILYLFLRIISQSSFRISYKFLGVLFILVSLFSILFYIFVIPPFLEHTLDDQDTLALLGSVDGNFLIVEHPTSYTRAYYSYSPIYYDLTSPHGWMDTGTTKDHIKNIKLFTLFIMDGVECEDLENLASKLKVDEVITIRSNCELFEECNINIKDTKGDQCLFEFL